MKKGLQKICLLTLLGIGLISCGGETSETSSIASSSSSSATSETTSIENSSSEETTSETTSELPASSETTSELPVSSETTSEVISTIAEAQATTDINKDVIVKGVVVAATSKSLMISDGTGKIVLWLNKTPTNTIGQYIKVTGKLSVRNGNKQFSDSCKIELLPETAPTLPNEQSQTWTASEINSFVSTDMNERGIGALVSITGQLSISGYYYNALVDGTNYQISLQYLTDSQKDGLVDGKNYTFTGYLTDTSTSNDITYVNLYYLSSTEVGYSAITTFEIDSTEDTINLIVGGTKSLSVNIEPALANKGSTWSSNNETVATIDQNGKITAVAAGNATITVTSVGKNALDVNVTDTINVVVTAAQIDNENLQTVSYNFKGCLSSSATAANKLNSSNEILGIFKASDETTKPTSITDIEKIYAGADGGSNANAYVNYDVFKIGQAKNTGSVTLVFGDSIIITKVSVKAIGWKNDSTLVINGNVQTPAVAMSKSSSIDDAVTLDYALATPTNSLTFASNGGTSGKAICIFEMTITFAENK